MHLFQINKKLILLKIHYFLSLAGLTPLLGFLSTILRQRGYSSVIVGLIFTFLPLPGLLIRPIVGGITDKYKCRKFVFILIMIIMSLLSIVLIFIPGTASKTQMDDDYVITLPMFWLFFMTVTLFHTGIIAKTLMEDTICMDFLGDEKHKYGQQRAWGSIGRGFIAIISGVSVDWFSKGQDYKNYTPIYVISLICNLLNIYVATKIEVVENIERQVIASNVKKLFSKISVLAYFLWVVLFGVLCPFIWYYVYMYMEEIADIYHPETKPYIKTIQGVALSIQCFGGEFPFFFLSSYVIKHIGHMNSFSLMFVGFAVRFFLYSIITNPVWVLPVEMLNGVTYALAYSAAASYAAQIAPPGAEGTLQALLGTALMGFGVPMGSFLGGFMFDRFGFIVSFKILSGAVLAICVIQITVNQLINRFSKNENVNEEDESYTGNTTSDSNGIL
ncbi:major facilitator superfamily domain-containing protein 6-like [Myzus persicae]|uniref:major facilitator superfamily domain-containing protein 6-like n=1 Tax=Myzus persicae TaxID=13164 RepID=UPI000B933A06|nr:major facilitator superfamily domain-containing protein 6-like [Myzus persicae]